MSMTPSAGQGWHPGPAGPPAPRLELSRLFADSFGIFRSGFAPLLGLGAIPAAIGAGSTLALIWLYSAPFLTSLVSLNPVGLTSGPLLVIAAVGLATMLVTAQCGAMVAQVANQIADGARPHLAGAWRATTSIVPRLLLPYLSLAAGGWLAAALGVTWLLNGVQTAARSRDEAALGAVMLLLGTVVLAGVLLVIVGVLARVKLFLFLPAASLERLSGLAALRRSVELTRGCSGVILGAVLVVGAAETAGGGLAGRVSDLFLREPITLDGIGGLETMGSVLMPGLTAVVLIGAAFASVTAPFLTVLSSVVHRFRTRPAPIAPQPEAWAPQWPGQSPQPPDPGYWTPPGPRQPPGWRAN